MLLHVDTLALVLATCSLNVKLRLSLTPRYTGLSELEPLSIPNDVELLVAILIFKMNGTKLGFLMDWLPGY